MSLPSRPLRPLAAAYGTTPPFLSSSSSSCSKKKDSAQYLTYYKKLSFLHLSLNLFLIETENKIKLIHPDARRPQTNAILVGLRSCREAGARPASCSLDPTKIALSWASYGLQRSFGSPPVQAIRPFDLLCKQMRRMPQHPGTVAT
jgi:hypothetical protein